MLFQLRMGFGGLGVRMARGIQSTQLETMTRSEVANLFSVNMAGVLILSGAPQYILLFSHTDIG